MRHRLLAALAAVLLVSPATADDPIAGFSVTDLPGGPTYITEVLSTGEFVGLGNSTVATFEEDGTLIQVLHSFGSFVPPAALAVDPTETFVIVSRSDGVNSGTYRVDLATGTTTFLSFAEIAWPVFEDATHILFGASGGFLDWHVRRMDLTTGAVTQISEIYFSVLSPMAFDSLGRLYLAHDSDGDDDYTIERFSTAQLAGPALFAPGQGAVLHQGLDIPWDIELAPDDLTFFVAHGPSLSNDRITRFGPGPSQANDLVQVSVGVDVRRVQFLPPTPPAQFRPYQPPTGGRVVYVTASGGQGTKLRRALDPARPTLALSGPGTTGVGPFDLTLAGGPPNGTARILLCPLTLFDPVEQVQIVGGIPVFYGLDRPTIRPVPMLLGLDANGDGTTTLNNGTGPGTWAMQALIFGQGGLLLGSTTAAFL